MDVLSEENKRTVKGLLSKNQIKALKIKEKRLAEKNKKIQSRTRPAMERIKEEP